MILTNNQQELLNRCIGAGPIDRASLIIFGNEPGIAGSRNIENAISIFEDKYRSNNILKIGEGFSIIARDSPPTNSFFLQFSARMELALKYKKPEFFGELSHQEKTILNKHIMNDLFVENSALINLKPFPRSTERSWVYANIKEKDYYNSYNFARKGLSRDEYRDIRVKILKQAFDSNKNSLILGSGNRHIKKAFFEHIYPNIIFEEINLDTIFIFVSRNPKIILSNYYDHRSGIKLSGLKQIYNFIIENSL